MMMWHGWDMGHGWGWGGWLVGGLMMLLFWGGLIVLAFFALRALTRSGQENHKVPPRLRGEGTALQILQKRYARGEVSREEFLDIKQDLEM
jgi:putative membrane protein